jgi:hypothetical protein
MAQGRSYEPTTSPSDAWAGWITFAAVTLTLIGPLNLFQGFIALFDDESSSSRARRTCCSSTSRHGA